MTRVTTQQAAFSGNASQLISSGDINLNIGTGRNAYSLISAQGDVNLLATSFVNEGLDLQETTEVWHDFHRARKSGIFSSTKHTYWTVNDPTVVANIGSVFSTVEAGGAINGSVTGYLQNGAVQSGVTSTSGTGTTPGYTTTHPGTSTLAPLNTSLAGLTGSSIGNPGLVVPVTTPNAPFLLETRFEFVNLENFLSSDYFLGEFNIDLADLEKRLGDAYVETLFIREQLFALTGQRLLNGAIDERAQMQAMYDNAIDAATNLDLAFGVALTPEQIAALTEDIIWLEEVEIDGQMVLVPHVYLASASTLANVNSASQFVARDIAVLAGEFVSSGTLNAEQGLQVASLGDFRNLGGSLIAGGDLSLDIAGTLHSVSGDIRGRNVAIAANEIVIETAALDHGRSDATAQTATRQSSITAAENMTLQATEDLILIGADLNAGGDTVLVAGGDLIAGALALESHADMTFSGGYYRADGIENVVSSINGGGDVFMVSTGTASGGDLILEGAQVAAAGALTLRAEQGDVILAAAQDMFNSDLRGSSSGFLSKSESRDQVFDLSHQVVSISGSSIDISASGSVLAEGTQFAIPGALDGVSGAEALNSRDLRIIAAGGDLTFAAVTDIHAESHFESSSFLGGLGGSMRDLKTLETTALGARADIAGDIRLRSAGDLTLTAVDFKAGGQFSTEVAGATRVLAAVDTSYRSLSEMNNNMVMITTVNSEDYTESATFSSIEAAGGVDFDVTSDVTLAGVRDQLISGQHAAQLLQDGDHGMAIAASFLGKTDPSTGPPTEGDTSDTSNWRDDLNVTVAALPTGEDGAGYLYLDGLTARDGTTIEAITLIDEHFYEETKALSPAFKALLTIVVTQGIGGLGGFGGGFGEMIGLSSDLAISVANTFASNLTVGVIDGAVTGNLDLGAIVGDAAFAAVGAGLTSGINLDNLGVSLDETGLLTGGNNLTLQAIGEGALDSAIRSGLNSAVYGTDFGKGFLSGVSGSVVNLAMADVQHGIGDLFEAGANGGEGSFGHITLHALTGCVAAELQNASCASGAAGAAAQAIYAGTEPGAGTLTDDQIKNRAELIGGIAGFFASEGKGENVSTAASIARSGAENNYLKHDQFVSYQDGIEECGGDEACLLEVHKAAEVQSLENEHRFLMCSVNGNCQEIMKEVEYFGADAMANASPLIQSLQNSAYYNTRTTARAHAYSTSHIGFVTDARDALGYPDELLENGNLSYAKFNGALCGGMSNADCVRAYKITDAIRSEADSQTQISGAGLALLAGGTAATGCGALVGCLLVGAGGAYEVDQLETSLDNLSSTGQKEDVNFVQALVAAGVDPATARSAHFWTGVGLGVADVAILVRSAPGFASRSGAPNNGLPPGYRLLDDSIGASRVDPPSGYRWVTNDGTPQLQSTSNGQIFTSVDNVPTPTGRFSGSYESNPKHNVTRPGVSPQPTNGADALSNSVPLGGNSTGRIAYDSTTNEIVVFQNHLGSSYHGYVPSSWSALRQTEKNALIRAGLFTARGRPIR